MYQTLARLICVSTLALWATQARAAVVVSNLNAAVAGTGTIYASGPPQSYAQEFLTGSQSVELASVIAVLGTASPSFTASATLLANNGGLPGSTVITTFSVPTIPTTTPVNLTFTPASNVTLAANTDYWFALSATGSGSFKWDYTDTLSASLPNYAVSNNSGSTWSIGTPPGPFLIEVDSSATSATPEPATFALFALVGLASLLWRYVQVALRGLLLTR